MPSSRKRNKGKDRKAKKAAEKEEAVKMAQVSWIRGFMSGSRVSIQCNHGLDMVLDKSHPVSSFIDTFSVSSLHDAITKHPEVKNKNNLRQMAADVLTMIGTNMLIEGGAAKENNLQFINNTAIAIMILEQLDTLDYESKSTNPRVISKIINLGTSPRFCERDLLKFYRKRMKCKCLKKMHLEARKTLPKLGACGNCDATKERSLLMVCGRCMVAPYCSRECQVAASHKHRGACDSFVRRMSSTRVILRNS